MKEQFRHHHIFEGIQLYSGPIPAGFNVDFLGTCIRRFYDEDIFPEHKNRPDQTSPAGLPPFDNEYFEWIDLLESVKNAKGEFIFVELGAGYGRWSVRAAQAIRRLNPLPFKIIAVEGEPTHYEFLKRNFHDNGINPSDCSLMKVAVWNKKGTVKFHTGNPTGWYGQCIMKQPLFSTIKSTLLYLLGAYNPNDKSGITVPTITLDEILSLLHHVDLIDIDIQGTELDVISHSIEIINEKVMRIHIGTHSSEIEERLRDIFLKNNWRKHFYYQLQSTIETPYGKIKFDDGVQSWINPRLVV